MVLYELSRVRVMVVLRKVMSQSAENKLPVVGELFPENDQPISNVLRVEKGSKPDDDGMKSSW